MIQSLLSMYRLGYPAALTYMLQASEYQIRPYLKWLSRTRNFNEVMLRRTLKQTKAARMLLLALRLGIGLQVLVGIVLIYLGHWHGVVGGVYFGLAVIIVYPLFWAYAVIVPLALGRWFIFLPKERELIRRSQKIFAQHGGIKVAVAGSYGKTTMKELLLTVLSEGRKVAATPANRNVASSHAEFARLLQGDEDILIIEYGEGAPGDVARFAATTQPTHAIITGLAPAHLDHYKTLQAAGHDIFALADYLQGKQVYVDDDSPSIKPFIKENYAVFNINGALGWRVEQPSIELSGTSFLLHRNKQTLTLQSGLIGRHQLAFLAFVAAFALELGLTPQQVETGIGRTKPFEHRMQPRWLNGAWLIDDTYNGNLEGIRAGTQLLAEVAALRKIYVTPGLVDQGAETEKVHVEIGKLIGEARPDIVVLMENTVTPYIERGLAEAGYVGDIRVQDDPLEFYTNLNHFIATGDVVLLQNDWTDNYA